jgi:hypothetical protein
MIRAQEQLAAQQQYAALLQAQRQQDLAARQITSQEQLGQLQAKTAYEKGLMDVGEGEAGRRQKAYGGILTAVGGLLSAIEAKESVTPVGQPQYLMSPPEAKQGIAPIGGFQQPGYAGPEYQTAQPTPPQTAGQALSPYSQGYSARELGALTATYNPYAQQAPQQQPAANPYQIDQQLMAARNDPYAALYAAKQKDSSQGDIGAALGALGGAVSDPAAKTGANPVGELASAAAQVQPYAFNYRPEFARELGVSEDRRVGIMANKAPGNLSENPVYGPAVVKGPDGLARVDTNQAVGANIAVTADIAREQQDQSARLDALEQAAMGNIKKAFAKKPAAAPQRSIDENGQYRPVAMTNRDYDQMPRMGKSIGRAVSRGTDEDVSPGNVGAPGLLGARPQYARARSESGPVIDAQTADENMFLPALEYGKGHRPSPEDYRTDQLSDREESLAAAAARTGGAKKRDDRILGLRELADAMVNRSMSRQALTPKALEAEARRRGIKVKPGEARDALRNEMDL